MIKLVAILTMVIDHVAVFLLPQYTIVFRAAGSVSFPLFAWMIVEGRFNTSNVKKYLQNLLLFAAVSEPVYMLMYPGHNHYNAIFTLFWGLFLICAYERFGLLVFLGLLPLLHFDVISCYVVLIFLFYFARNKPFIITVGSCLFFLFVSTWAPDYVLFGLLFLPLIFIDNLNFRLPVNKYVFYSFYPVHFLIIWGIMQCLS